MFHAVLFMCFASLARHAAAIGALCEPSKFLCSGHCPPLPEGMEKPTSEAVCSRDPSSDTCICWLHNPSSHVHTLFQCEARINDTARKLACVPPSHCFSPQPGLVCLIILHCPCLLYEHHKPHQWNKVKAIVHTMNKSELKDFDINEIEKVQSDMREFSLKHLFFLVGFVIAPLLCWCLLNFFHEGKCRKKRAPQLTQGTRPMPRTCTVESSSYDSTPLDSCSVPMPPSAPSEEDSETDHSAGQALLKCESPPPYNETVDGNYSAAELGPPPAYEEAMRGCDVQHMWQTVFTLQSREDT